MTNTQTLQATQTTLATMTATQAAWLKAQGFKALEKYEDGRVTALSMRTKGITRLIQWDAQLQRFEVVSFTNARNARTFIMSGTLKACIAHTLTASK